MCERYHADGSKCTNLTDYRDGWCRNDECAGFTRASPSIAPESLSAPRGTARHIAETGHAPVDMDLDEVADIHVTLRASESFRFHHGGQAAAAEAQLRSMLEDFLLRSARSSRNGFVRLARDGYELVLSEDLSAITAYSTAHRERTWAQVQAGVGSRFGKAKREPSGEAPEPGPDLPSDQVAAALDPATVHLTSRTRTSFARLFAMGELGDAELDGKIRAALVQLKDGHLVVTRTTPCAEIVVGDLRWLVSDDARRVVGVNRLTTPLGD